MSDLAITVEGLSKCYRIGARAPGYRTLRETISQGLSSPVRNLHHKGLRKNSSGVIWALKDVSFQVRSGEVIGIIGRNGAGKSTLLKILSRITRPTQGELHLRGRVGSLLEVGTGFHPELTGRENIYLNAAILGMRRVEMARKFDDIVGFAEIGDFLDTPVKRYSSGMYMRLAFSVAAHLEPEILLVDEVLAVGDIAFQKKCLGKMGEVTRQGHTVLFVSHNLAAIQQICNHGILLEAGRLVSQGSMTQVVQEYIGNAGSSCQKIALSPADHVTGMNGIQVLYVEVHDGLGAAFMVPWKQPIHLSIGINVTRSFKNVSFGLGVMTLDGVPVLTVHDTDFSDSPTSLSAGRYIIEVNLDNPLRLGIYSLILGAHDAISKSSIFYIPNAVRLEVTNPINGQDQYHEHNAGIINGSSTWSLSKD